MKNNSSTPLLSCYSLSVLLKLSYASSIALPVFPFQEPLFSASMVMAQSKITMDLSDTDLFSCLQTITVDIPSSCEYHAGNRSHKLQSSKVINGTGKLLSAWVILCAYYRAVQLSACQSVTKPFSSNKEFDYTCTCVQ